MAEEQTLLQIEVALKDLMDDLKDKILKVYDKYTDSSKQIPKLPPYASLKSDSLRYELSRNLTDAVDELLEMKLRAGVLYRDMMQYQEYQPKSKSDYLVGQKFKTVIKGYLEELDQIRFELSDLVKNANNKIRILDSVQYYDM